MNWSEYPYLRIAIAFALGIFVFEYFDLNARYALILLAISSITYVGVELRPWISLNKPNFTGSLFLLVFFALGCVTMSLRKYTDNSKIITALPKENIFLSGVIQENLKSEAKLRYVLKTETYSKQDKKVNSHVSDVIIQFDKSDSLASTYLPGHYIAVNATLSQVKTSTNPESFDYAYFLRTKGIFQQASVKANQHKLISTDNFNAFRTFAEKTKLRSSKTIHKYIQNPEALGIAEALLLGKQTLISADIYQDFADTGAIHVLSVSGLHVAIFISLFIWLFDKIKNKSTSFKILKVLILLLIIAFYVILTGMSPSVMRAGFMVSLYIIGKNFFKNTNTYNILSISAICLLLYDPYYLFQLSFQLSYLSLLSILYFQPQIKKWWLPESKILQFVWDLVNVSLAAQILVFPLTIYYFHKFPMYFMLSGIIAVPLVTVLIYMGTVILVFEYFYDTISQALAPIFNSLLVFLHKSISFLADLPYSKFDNLWIGSLILFLSYVFILGMMIWIETRKIKVFVASLSLLFIIIFSINMRSILENQNNSLVIYDVFGGTLVDGFIQNTWHTFQSSTISDKTVNFVAINNRIKHRHQSKEVFRQNIDSSHLFKINDKLIYFHNSDNDFRRLKPDFEVDYLVISKSKKSDPTYILDKLKPRNVILDRNVPPWIIEKWETYSDKDLFKLHIIKNEGAFISSM